MTQQDKQNLPIGIDDFVKLRENQFYYVDKTGLIIDLLRSWCEVTLITRPRRFGKSLNMSMLEAFFSPDSDKSLFDGLAISGEKELCDRYMGRYPVIALSLKGVNAGSFETARALLVLLVRDAAKRYESVLPGSSRLSATDRKDYEKLLDENMTDPVLYRSLQTLSALLEKQYRQKVVILIDEYDVPLAKAYDQGYDQQMTLLIRNLFEYTLKTNRSLKFAVVTGCMRISKESIFTGLNNLQVRSVSDEEYDEYFGFTDAEVRQMLGYYGFPEYCETVKDWYDGYLFGQTAVYCPWDVICYCRKLCTDSDHSPENYWIHSSGNDVIRKFVRHSGNAEVRSQLEALINGEAVEKTLNPELTYEDMYASVDNIWSVLFTTGYLTQKERSRGSGTRLVIPNREVRDIFAEQILALFREEAAGDTRTLERLCHALESGDCLSAEQCLGEYLRKTISIRDTAVRRALKENFYQGILVGILGCRAGWSVTSNQEAGDGYADILVRLSSYELAMILEVKYAEAGDPDTVCLTALRQIEERNYAQRLYDDGFEHVLKYGIAFYLKRCRVMKGGDGSGQVLPVHPDV